MLRSVITESNSIYSQRAIENRGNGLSLGATDCPAVLMARGRWPRKTAECWAAAAGIQPRMAKYWLAGSHPVSADGKLALIRELA